MKCMLCRRQLAIIKCLQCQIPLCQECASLYLVGNGCSPYPAFLCPSCYQEYSSDNW
ncbi:MAG: hypothetical protein GX119_06570 [Syntrophomonadaceae bacterium]|nr:hypothetical protein [Syntrophomonadaceae bacterium]